MPEMGGRIYTYAVTVTTTPTRIAPQQPDRVRLLIYNNGSDVVYIVPDNTTPASKGYPLAAGAKLDDRWSIGEVWAIAASGSQDVRVLVVTK